MMEKSIIIIDHVEDEKNYFFIIEVEDENSAKRYEVKLDKEYFSALRKEDEKETAFVQRVFKFLLEREPKESILSKFDVRDVSRYFPEFEEVIKKQM